MDSIPIGKVLVYLGTLSMTYRQITFTVHQGCIVMMDNL